MTQAQQSPYPVLAPGPYLPLDRTAVGPDWSEGSPYFVKWHPNALSVGRVVQQPANFGQQGGAVGYRKMALNIIGNPLEPTSLPHKPVYNVMIPPVTFNLAVMTKQQLATFENSNNVQAPQLPLTFSAPGTASLLK